jgi:mono/diheme cytochrome c family protein
VVKKCFSQQPQLNQEAIAASHTPLWLPSGWEHRGRRLSVFEKNCTKCHGKTATSRHFGGPSLASERVNATSPDDLLNIISNGKDRMPKYAGKLTSEEIDTLVQQIKSLNLK